MPVGALFVLGPCHSWVCSLMREAGSGSGQEGPSGPLQLGYKENCPGWTELEGGGGCVGPAGAGWLSSVGRAWGGSPLGACFLTV